MSFGLPVPVSVWSSNGAQFNIYRARDLLSDSWNSDVLKKIVLTCRKSFLKYGQRPLLDDFDLKAAVYLVRADYEHGNYKVSEWLCIRMVPGHGNPIGVLEPELYYMDGKRLDIIIFGDKWSLIVSSSRMCSIRPSAFICSGVDTIPRRNKYTAQSFALIHEQFICDYPVNYEYISAIISEEFISRILTVDNNGISASPFFMPVTELLKVSSEEVMLDRSIYAYKFPTYWFNPADLLRLVRDLFRDKIITLETLSCYFGSDSLDIGENNLKNLSFMFYTDSKIMGATITGHELQQIADSCLQERPKLRVAPVERWNLAIKNMVRVGDLKKIS